MTEGYQSYHGSTIKLAPLNEVFALVGQLMEQNRIMRDSLGVTTEQVDETIASLNNEALTSLKADARRDFFNSELWALLLQADRKLRILPE